MMSETKSLMERDMDYVWDVCLPRMAVHNWLLEAEIAECVRAGREWRLVVSAGEPDDEDEENA